MNLQKDWVVALQPKASMLKFRLPWEKGIHDLHVCVLSFSHAGTTQYLKGEIFLPIWGRETTTETRLISTEFDLVSYDNSKYEEQCFYFNRIHRVMYFLHSVDTGSVVSQFLSLI